LRSVFDAILYVARSGCQWRLLPADFPCWKTVYHHFRRWSLDGTLDLLNQALRAAARAIAGKRARPTAVVIDSQTVRSDPHGGDVAYDAAKKTKGRKRFLCVDTLGLVLDVVLLPANTPEREGAKILLEPVLQRHS
jgi:putative transposase